MSLDGIEIERIIREEVSNYIQDLDQRRIPQRGYLQYSRATFIHVLQII